jgi:translation initiation factor 2B subunit (eIF-2B alpha/beta/delta family)
MDKMIIGVDAIKLNGDIINKVGSFGMALSSYYSDVPVYIAASLLKIDMLDNIKIEQRESKEVWVDAPVNLKILNFAFDVVPSKFIKGIICEFGIIKPKEIKKYIKKYYNFLFLD